MCVILCINTKDCGIYYSYIKASYVGFRNVYVIKTLEHFIKNLESEQHSCDMHMQNLVNFVSSLMCNTSKRDVISRTPEDRGKVRHLQQTEKLKEQW